MFIDNMTCYTITFLLHTKDEALKAYKLYKVWATMQQHCKAIKILCLDYGGNYLSAAFNWHLAKASTVQKLTMYNTLQLNGIAKCLNCTLLKCIWAFTYVSSLPKSL